MSNKPFKTDQFEFFNPENQYVTLRYYCHINTVRYSEKISSSLISYFFNHKNQSYCWKSWVLNKRLCSCYLPWTNWIHVIFNSKNCVFSFWTQRANTKQNARNVEGFLFEKSPQGIIIIHFQFADKNMLVNLRTFYLLFQF